MTRLTCLEPVSIPLALSAGTCFYFRRWILGCLRKLLSSWNGQKTTLGFGPISSWSPAATRSLPRHACVCYLISPEALRRTLPELTNRSGAVAIHRKSESRARDFRIRLEHRSGPTQLSPKIGRAHV